MADIQGLDQRISIGDHNRGYNPQFVVLQVRLFRVSFIMIKNCRMCVSPQGENIINLMLAATSTICPHTDKTPVTKHSRARQAQANTPAKDKGDNQEHVQGASTRLRTPPTTPPHSSLPRTPGARIHTLPVSWCNETLIKPFARRYLAVALKSAG